MKKRLVLSMKFIIFLAVLCILEKQINHHLDFNGKVEAAILSSGTISPNQSQDTGNHILDSSYVQDITNWEHISKYTNEYWDPSGNKMFWLINNASDEVGYQISKTGLDFSKPISISIPWFYNNFVNDSSWKVGDGAGFLFTPATNFEISNNLSNLVQGGYLGVYGLKNTVYVGRDFYFNTLLDGAGDTAGPTSRIQIRRTDASGIIEYSKTQATWTESHAPGHWSTNNAGSNGSAWYSETMSMKWSNITDNGNGTYTGDIEMNVHPNSGYSGDNTTITRRVTLQKNMNFGALAVTGSNYGVIQEGQATSEGKFSASRATEKVRVNFVNQNTGKMIDSAPNSSILANLGDTIGVAKSGANRTDTYTYTAPVVPGYDFSSANSVTVINYINDSISPNIINVQYIPQKRDANFKWQYVGTGNVPTLPAMIVQTGDVDSAIFEPQLPALPYGYEIQDVMAPDGQVYPDVKTALAVGDNGIYPTSGSVDFTIRVKLTAPLIPLLDSVPDFEAISVPIQSDPGVYPIKVSNNGKLQVSDERVSHSGWQLTAAMTQQFTSDVSIPEDKAPIGVYLKGAFLSFKPKTPETLSGNTSTAPDTAEFKVLEDGAQVIVMIAAVNKGGGQWNLPFEDIALNTLDSDIKAGITYSAKITWTLSDVP